MSFRAPESRDYHTKNVAQGKHSELIFLSIGTHFGVMVGDHLMCVFKERRCNAFTFLCMLTSWVCNVFESMSKYKSQAFHVNTM